MKWDVRGTVLNRCNAGWGKSKPTVACETVYPCISIYSALYYLPREQWFINLHLPHSARSNLYSTDHRDLKAEKPVRGMVIWARVEVGEGMRRGQNPDIFGR